MNTNVSGIPTPRRRRAGACDALNARTRPSRRSVRHATHGRSVRALVTTVVRRDPTSAVVEVLGEIDVHTAAELRTILLALADEGRTRLVADFSGVLFCDAAGLGALVAVNNRLRERGGSLRLSRVRPAQQRILRITRLDRVFANFGSADEALAGPSSDA